MRIIHNVPGKCHEQKQRRDDEERGNLCSVHMVLAMDEVSQVGCDSKRRSHKGDHFKSQFHHDASVLESNLRDEVREYS